MKPVGAVFSRRQNALLQLSGLDVLIQQYICLTDDRLVRLAACDELPFVETGAIIKQEFDIPCNK